jgi:DNA-binding protein HU-beta
MSKSDFILAVAKKADLPKAEAKRVIELVFGTIEASLKGLKGGGKLPIGNFGVFTVAKRPARMGRNPRTGEAIKIKASKKLRFRPAKTLKTAAGIVPAVKK